MILKRTINRIIFETVKSKEFQESMKEVIHPRKQKIFWSNYEQEKLVGEWIKRKTKKALSFEDALDLWNKEIELGIQFPVMILVEKEYLLEKMKIVSSNGKVYCFCIQYPTPLDDYEEISINGQEYNIRRKDGLLYTHEQNISKKYNGEEFEI